MAKVSNQMEGAGLPPTGLQHIPLGLLYNYVHDCPYIIYVDYALIMYVHSYRDIALRRTLIY